MLVRKEEAIKKFQEVLGDRCLLDEVSLKNGEALTGMYAKAFGIYENPLPIAILNVATTEEVSELLKYCNQNRITVIPKTGGSGGELLLQPINDQTVFMDGSLMNEIIEIDEENMMVTAKAGTPLELIENTVREKGLTTGHGPQSLPMADIGGLVATRSIGQFSTYYGAIEDMVCGLEAVRANGEIMRIRNVPRRAFGPDLRQIWIGSEGAFGMITEVTVKLFPFYPDSMWMGGYIMKDIDSGFKAIADITTSGYKPSVVRLYDKPDMDYNFNSVKLKDEESFMFFVAEGPPEVAKAFGEGIHRKALEHGGEYIGSEAVEHWMEHRNDLCKMYGDPRTAKAFRETNVLYSTLEISASWTDIIKIYHDVMENVPKKIDNLIMLGGHVSHSYQNGTNIYFVFRIKISEPTAASKEHNDIVYAICDEVIKYPTGGTVNHHGSGKRRVKYAKQEHGTSYPLLVDIKKMMDPNAIMNPGVLIFKEDL